MDSNQGFEGMLRYILESNFTCSDIINLDDLLRKRLEKFIDQLEPGSVYSIMVKAKLLGVDGVYIRSMGEKRFFEKGVNREAFIRTIIAKVKDGLLKYDQSLEGEIYIDYYKNISKYFVNSKMLKRIGEGLERELLMILGLEPSIIKSMDLLKNSKEFEFKHTYDFPLMKKVNRLNKNMLPIVVIDLETYKDKDGILTVYAAGFKSDDNIKMYYMLDYQSSDVMVRTFLEELLLEVKDGSVIYAHNFARFDGFLLYRHLRRMQIEGILHMAEIITSNAIKLLKINLLSKKYKGKSVRIQDSYNILGASLRKLCEAFNVKEAKGYFPHSFVTIDRLGYSGGTPSKEYFEEISDNEYEEIKSENWVLRDECLKYLRLDLVSLMEILKVFTNLIKKEYNLDVGRSVSISALAFRIFRAIYYKEELNVKIIHGNVYKDIKRGFFGGKTEVYERKGKNLYYYDVNSLYPFSMLKDMPVGNPTLRYFKIPVDSSILNKAFGFAHVQIKAPKGIKRPILPVRIDGRIYNPLGSWSGIYFIEELKQAIKYGYEIKVDYLYEFERGKDLFKEYILDNYKKKAENTGSKRQLYKLLLNSLFGRFGMLEYYPDNKIVSGDELLIIDQKEKVIDVQDIMNDEYRLEVDRKGISMLSEDMKENEGRVKMNIQSMPIAAAITAYSRIFMNKIIMDEKYKVFYTDTDSLVLNKGLPKELVSSKEIGKFKLEHKVKEGVFIVPKVYGLNCGNNKYICKVKGVRSKVGYEEIKEWIEMKRTKVFKEKRVYRDLESGIREEEVEINVTGKLIGRHLSKGYKTRPVNINKEYPELMKKS